MVICCTKPKAIIKITNVHKSQLVDVSHYVREWTDDSLYTGPFVCILRALYMVKGASIFKTTINVQRKKTQFCSLKV